MATLNVNLLQWDEGFVDHLTSNSEKNVKLRFYTSNFDIGLIGPLASSERDNRPGSARWHLGG